MLDIGIGILGGKARGKAFGRGGQGCIIIRRESILI